MKTATEWEADRARQAWERGCSALDAGDAAAAMAWLDRACRYAPTDLTPKLSLALACLLADDPAAAALFQEVAERAQAVEAWLGTAVAHEQAGRLPEAAAALHIALSGFASTPAVAVVAQRIARAAGFTGWCAVEDGRLMLRGPALASATVDGVTGWRDGDAVPANARTLRCRPMLLGSPINLAAIRRTEGLAEVSQDGIRGWAWHPRDARRDPVLTLIGGARRLQVTAIDPGDVAVRPLARPRRFAVPAASLAGFADPIAVLDDTGRHLSGSPVVLHPKLPPPRPRGRSVSATNDPGRSVAVIVPVYRGAAETEQCLRQTFSTVPPGTVVFVVDDASPEPALRSLLDRLAEAGTVRVLRHAENRGFPAAANTGLRAALALEPAHDVVLLNSDTVPAPGWLHILRKTAQASTAIGTATPFSNAGSIASYPAEDSAPPQGRALTALAALAALANPGGAIDVPTGVGFCLYVRHECLRQTGLFREDVFAQGYGEENDFCRRAAAQGWRHVVVPAAYVAHLGGRSFGDARAALLERNQTVLETLHPGYRAGIAEWRKSDPLAPARLRLDQQRFLAAARAQQRTAPRGSVLLVTHDSGGGVERCVQDRVAALNLDGYAAILLRPVLDPRETIEALDRRYRPGLLRIADATDSYPNLILPATELDVLADLLRPALPAWLEVHHLLGHDHAVLGLARSLAIPYEMRLHDYAGFCPRITLLNPAGKYCGEPDVVGCETCVSQGGSLLEETIGPRALQARSAADLAGARRVVVPSADMASRLRRHFPGIVPQIVAHEADPAGPIRPLPRGALLVAVIGAIGKEKGFFTLLGCAQDAASRDLPLHFVVVGHTLDDDALFETGRVRVTGPYREGEAASLIARQGAHLAFIPSIWPETWCFALGEAFSAGLPVAAFDLGAPAERIRRTGRGWLLPLGLSCERVNNCLIAFPRLAVAPNVMHTAVLAGHGVG